MKLAAIVWLLCVGIAIAYAVERWRSGIELRSDLLALLPDADRDPAVAAAKARLTENLDDRVVVLVGAHDRESARHAGRDFAQALRQSGTAAAVEDQISPEALRQQGESFFSHRSGLLSDQDRGLLEAGRGDEIVARALATIFGPILLVDAAQLRRDPFLLFPAFLSGLPSPVPRIQLDDGVPTARDNGKTYVLLTVRVAGNGRDTAVQERFVEAFDAAENALRARSADIEVLRLGSLFYFAAEGRMAKRQTMAISVLSVLGTVALVALVLRAARPLFLLAIAIATGIACALAVSLWWFGTLHVLTLTFGASLVGIAIDYCMQYFVTQLSAERALPAARLRRVLPAIFFGCLTTMIGYATLMATPFPGLREIAVFSAIGLAASFLTLVLWFPVLDRPRAPPSLSSIPRWTSEMWRLWEERRLRGVRLWLLAFGLVIVVLGTARLRFDDDIRRLQTLPRELQSQEESIRRLTGLAGGSQFLLVRGANDEAALQNEETLIPILDRSVQAGWLSGYQAVARIIPSAARQAQTRRLIRDALVEPFLSSLAARVGMPDLIAPTAPPDRDLTIDDIPAGSPLSYLRQLVLPGGGAGALHLILLNRVTDFARLRQAIAGFSDVTAVDPIDDITQILADYRQRALLLLLISVALMLPVLLWRYGIAGCLRVSLPSAGAIILTTAILAVFGTPFTFFTAMGLVLVLSIGFDYAIFCREASDIQKDVAMLGVWLALVTTLLSFGLLAFSGIFALRSFGLVLFVGTLAAFLFSPLARDPGRR